MNEIFLAALEDLSVQNILSVFYKNVNLSILKVQQSLQKLVATLEKISTTQINVCKISILN